MITKITPEAAANFERTYNATKDLHHMRLGQAFLNKFFPTEVDPDLFYCEKYYDCLGKIYTSYVDLGL